MMMVRSDNRVSWSAFDVLDSRCEYDSTKNDRLGRKDAPKPLQCCTGCDGKIKVTEDGKLDGIPCPVHLLLDVKAMQARAAKGRGTFLHDTVGHPHLDTMHNELKIAHRLFFMYRKSYYT